MITYHEYIQHNNLKSKGVIKYKNLNKIGKYIGLTLITYGIATIWNPISGSLFTISLGCTLIGISREDLKKAYKSKKHDISIRYKINKERRANNL